MSRGKDEAMSEFVERAIDRWLRVHGSATTGELARVGPLAALSPSGQSRWVHRITTKAKYKRERVPGFRGLRVRFAKEGN